MAKLELEAKTTPSVVSVYPVLWVLIHVSKLQTRLTKTMARLSVAPQKRTVGPRAMRWSDSIYPSVISPRAYRLTQSKQQDTIAHKTRDTNISQDSIASEGT